MARKTKALPRVTIIGVRQIWATQGKKITISFARITCGEGKRHWVEESFRVWSSLSVFLQSCLWVCWDCQLWKGFHRGWQLDIKNFVVGRNDCNSACFYLIPDSSVLLHIRFRPYLFLNPVIGLEGIWIWLGLEGIWICRCLNKRLFSKQFPFFSGFCNWILFVWSWIQ